MTARRAAGAGAACCGCLAIALAGCASGQQTARCPVTRPAGPPPPRKALLNFGSPVARRTDPGWYGDGTLYTQLPAWSGTWQRTPSGHALRAKVPWFRAEPGQVTVHGEALGGPQASFAADVGTVAEYGPTGFAPSVLRVGRPGCWRFTARLGGDTLRVVVDVRAPRG